MTADPTGCPADGAPRLITPAALRAWPLPEPGASKYERGQVVVVGGARGTPGAAMLAGLAALRVGAGKLSFGVARSVAAPVAVAIPESGVVGLDEEDSGSLTGAGLEALGSRLGRAAAVLVGPGLDEPEGTERLLRGVVERLAPGTPVALDAFAVGVLPELEEDLLAQLRGRLVLTPNTSEAARLLGVDEIEEGGLAEAAGTIAERYGAVVACGSLVVGGGQVWEKTSGDRGLGTSGSGDVLAGVVVGLLARGVEPVQAASWAVHVHGAAGDRLAARVGRVGFLARELLDELPGVLGELGGT
ncbi:NAD(P)H-hydrate dehydratase [Georgenia wangjunii]|uniref:NAD(P)H-hydrate dehydratase n=1 Tax=Georgenia wangjunii TaxID=3117730 RepID=UPI002F268A40